MKIDNNLETQESVEATGKVRITTHVSKCWHEGGSQEEQGVEEPTGHQAAHVRLPGPDRAPSVSVLQERGKISDHTPGADFCGVSWPVFHLGLS